MFDIVAMICVTVVMVTLIKAFAGAYTQPTYRYDDNDEDDN